MKPILFSMPMVQGIQTIKTKTRRVIKPQPPQDWFFQEDIDGEFFWSEHDWDDDMMGWFPSYDSGLAPTYKVGDILWVRETWLPFVPAHVIDARYAYKADMTPTSEDIRQKYLRAGFPYKWRPSIFMPRAAARLFLRVTDVHVERLQDISDADALAEGIRGFTKDGQLFKYAPADHEGAGPIWPWVECPRTPKAAFEKLWNSINAKRDGGRYAWGENPWVWVYTFERISKEEALAADCA